MAAPFDVRDDVAVRSGVELIADRFQGLDVVCCTAGVFAAPERPLELLDEDASAQLIDINLHGTIRVLRAAIPHVRDGGCLLVTASASGLMAHPGAAVYGATKAALIALARSLAAELGPRRIRVNAVCPGGVDTPMARGAFPEEADSDFAEYAAMSPLGRIAQPSDVAAAFTFLASGAARHITGVALRVDGGESLGGWV